MKEAVWQVFMDTKTIAKVQLKIQVQCNIRNICYNKNYEICKPDEYKLLSDETW